MNLDKQQTEKGCIEYVDPDMRSIPVPVRIPPNFVMYRVCGNNCCMNPQHMYFVDADTAHGIEMGLRDTSLAFLRKYFKVDPQTFERLEPLPPPPREDPGIWLPRR